MLLAVGIGLAIPSAQEPTALPSTASGAAMAAGSLDEAFRLFYIGHYDESAALALALRDSAPDVLTTYELRSSALHFRIKREVSGARDKKAALRACGACPALLKELTAEIARGRTIARDRLKGDEGDLAARFYLGKIDLTHVWLHLETLGQRTGWGEYWEARRSLDHVIEQQPAHVRALSARAWIDYIVDTRVPFGVRWMLGGGDKKRALVNVRKAAEMGNAGRFDRAEARFALWEMLTREKRRDEAVEVARMLLAEFPENRDLAKFIEGP
jgi:hypothetical protein